MAHPLRRFRKERGLSLEELAGALGTSSATISRFERGLQNPPLDLLTRIVEFTGGKVTAEEVLRKPPEPVQ